jgi:putative membrane protein
MWGGIWWIFPIIMFIVMVIFFFLRSGRKGFRPPWMQGSDRDHRESTDSETPLEILKKRYAKGEINKEEFDQMKKDL